MSSTPSVLTRGYGAVLVLVLSGRLLILHSLYRPTSSFSLGQRRCTNLARRGTLSRLDLEAQTGAIDIQKPIPAANITHSET